jgi:hypothetical protein
MLGALLSFVFSMPAVFIHVLGAGLQDFILMQVCGIGSFMLAANSAGRLVERFGAGRVIYLGTLLGIAGTTGLLIHALLGGGSILVITLLFVPFNMGLGLRGPPAFYRAVVAARGDDARGAALVILFILGFTTAGTSAVAPFISSGLLAPAAVAFVLQALALLCLGILPSVHPGPAEPVRHL